MDLIPLPAGAVLISAPLAGESLSLTQLQTRLGKGKMSLSSLCSSLLQQAIFPIVITMLLVSIPLNSPPEADGISYPLFVFFTVVYTCIGYPLLMLPFDYALPGLPNVFRWLPGIVGIPFCVLFMVFVWYMGWEKKPYIFVTPPFANWCFLIITFFLYCRKLDARRKGLRIGSRSKDSNSLESPLVDNDPEEVVAKAAPVHDRIRVSQAVFFFDPPYDLTEQRNAFTQLLFAFAFECGIMASFFFCQFMAEAFAAADTASEQILQYFIFAIVVFLLKSFMKIIGIVLDGGKTGGASMCYAGEIVGLAFYLLFYRNLFGSLVDVETFVFIQIGHVVLEMLMYPFRMTRLYFRFSEVFLEWVQGFCTGANQGTFEKLSSKEYQWMVVVEYCCRLVITFESLIAYISTFAFIRYGYNSKHFAFFSAIDGREYQLLLLFCIAALIVECIAASVVLISMSRLSGFPVTRPLKEFASSRQLYWFMICATAHITTDIFLARADNNFV
eukprot:ANDGO_00534.mRNA.1 hypothetical protein